MTFVLLEVTETYRSIPGLLSYQTLLCVSLRLLGKMPEPPTPAELIPTYIVDGLDRQDRETLAAVEQYTRHRREYLRAVEQQDIDEEELTEEPEELVDIEESSDGTIVIKKVPCGKDCAGCPHGSYKYIVSREGDSLNWRYEGPVDQ